MRDIRGRFSYSTKKLCKITISPKNKIFILKNDQILLGKSDIKSDNFDILVFLNPDIQKVRIPSSIKIISPIFIPRSNFFDRNRFRREFRTIINYQK